MSSMYLSILIIILLTLWAAKKFGSIKHPATYLAVGVNIFNCLLEPLGKSETVQTLLEAMIKG